MTEIFDERDQDRLSGETSTSHNVLDTLKSISNSLTAIRENLAQINDRLSSFEAAVRDDAENKLLDELEKGAE